MLQGGRRQRVGVREARREELSLENKVYFTLLGWEMVINNQEPCHHHQVYSDKLEESQGSMAELRHKIAGDVVIV